MAADLDLDYKLMKESAAQTFDNAAIHKRQFRDKVKRVSVKNRQLRGVRGEFGDFEGEERLALMKKSARRTRIKTGTEEPSRKVRNAVKAFWKPEPLTSFTRFVPRFLRGGNLPTGKQLDSLNPGKPRISFSEILLVKGPDRRAMAAMAKLLLQAGDIESNPGPTSPRTVPVVFITKEGRRQEKLMSNRPPKLTTTVMAPVGPDRTNVPVEVIHTVPQFSDPVDQMLGTVSQRYKEECCTFFRTPLTKSCLVKEQGQFRCKECLGRVVSTAKARGRMHESYLNSPGFNTPDFIVEIPSSSVDPIAEPSSATFVDDDDVGDLFAEPCSSSVLLSTPECFLNSCSSPPTLTPRTTPLGSHASTPSPCRLPFVNPPHVVDLPPPPPCPIVEPQLPQPPIVNPAVPTPAANAVLDGYTPTLRQMHNYCEDNGLIFHSYMENIVPARPIDDRVVTNRNVQLTNAPLRIAYLTTTSLRSLNYILAIAVTLVVAFGFFPLEDLFTDIPVSGAVLLRVCRTAHVLIHLFRYAVQVTTALTAVFQYLVLLSAFRIDYAGRAAYVRRKLSYLPSWTLLFHSGGLKHITFVPHVVSCIVAEYHRGTNNAVVAATVRQRMLRLATLPILDKDYAQLLDGTEQIIEWLVAQQDFADRPVSSQGFAPLREVD